MNRRGARLEAHPQPAAKPAVDMALAHSRPDTTIEDLLSELRGSPTDLAKLVTRVERRHCRVVAIPAKAIARWSEADPASWNRVRAWLTARRVRIVDE